MARARPTSWTPTPMCRGPSQRSFCATLSGGRRTGPRSTMSGPTGSFRSRRPLGHGSRLLNVQGCRHRPSSLLRPGRPISPASRMFLLPGPRGDHSAVDRIGPRWDRRPREPWKNVNAMTFFEPIAQRAEAASNGLTQPTGGEKGAIVLDRVIKHYGDERVVDGVTLAIRPGEFFSLLGPSGSGKTTTLMMIAGFAGIDGGSI